MASRLKRAVVWRLRMQIARSLMPGIHVARKVAWPGKRCLFGEEFENAVCTIGKAGALAQTEIAAPFALHRLLHVEHGHDRSPPPGGKGRALALRHGAPTSEL